MGFWVKSLWLSELPFEPGWKAKNSNRGVRGKFGEIERDVTLI